MNENSYKANRGTKFIPINEHGTLEYHASHRVKYLTDGAVILPTECYEEATCITNRITRLAHERRLKAIEDKELP